MTQSIENHIHDIIGSFEITNKSLLNESIY